MPLLREGRCGGDPPRWRHTVTTKIIELKHPNGFILGSAIYREPTVFFPGGWRFFPNVTSRSPSRKTHPTAHASLPAWARRWFARGATFEPRGEAR